MDLEQTIEKITEQSQKIGDLPIFSASLNRVRKVSSDYDSTAMALSMEVMKDANMSARLLKLANSNYYNRGKGSIRTISRAVVILGFETIKNLCMTVKLIDSFQSEHPAINMNQMLVNAFVSGGIVRDLAGEVGINDIEGSYISGLLHHFGEIIVAYYLPNEYMDMQIMRREEGMSYREAQRSKLGGEFHQISKAIATKWDFPDDVVKTMTKYNLKSAKRLHKRDMNHALAAFGNSMTANIYGMADDDSPSYSTLLGNLSKITGITPKKLESTMLDSFKNSCELAEEYGLQSEYLEPKVTESDDNRRDSAVRMFAFHVESKKKKSAGKQEKTEPDTATEKTTQVDKAVNAKAERKPVATEESGQSAETADESNDEGNTSDAAVQLEIMQEITALMTENAGVHRVFVKAVEGIYRGVGFDNVMLCLLSADHRMLTGRIGMGKHTEQLKEILNIATTPATNLLVQCMLTGNEQIITDSRAMQAKNELPDQLNELISECQFVIAPLRSGSKPVGLFYADKSVAKAAISDVDFKGFIQFVKQANLALQYADMAKAAARKSIA